MLTAVLICVVETSFFATGGANTASLIVQILANSLFLLSVSVSPPVNPKHAVLQPILLIHQHHFTLIQT